MTPFDMPSDLPDIHEASESHIRGSINTIGWLAASFVMGMLVMIVVLA